MDEQFLRSGSDASVVFQINPENLRQIRILLPVVLQKRSQHPLEIFPLDLLILDAQQQTVDPHIGIKNTGHGNRLPKLQLHNGERLPVAFVYTAQTPGQLADSGIKDVLIRRQQVTGVFQQIRGQPPDLRRVLRRNHCNDIRSVREHSAFLVLPLQVVPETLPDAFRRRIRVHRRVLHPENTDRIPVFCLEMILGQRNHIPLRLVGKENRILKRRADLLFFRAVPEDHFADSLEKLLLVHILLPFEQRKRHFITKIPDPPGHLRNTGPQHDNHTAGAALPEFNDMVQKRLPVTVLRKTHSGDDGQFSALQLFGRFPGLRMTDPRRLMGQTAASRNQRNALPRLIFHQCRQVYRHDKLLSCFAAPVPFRSCSGPLFLRTACRKNVR